MTGHFAHLAFTDEKWRRAPERIEFTDYGRDVLESEALTDAAYRVFLTVLAKGYGTRGNCVDFQPADAALMLYDGLYLPCVKRVTLVDEVDQRNDGLPERAAVVVMDDAERCLIYQVRRIDKFPRPIAAVAPGIRYKMIEYERAKGHQSRRERRWPGFASDMDDDVLLGNDCYFTVTKDDRIVHAIDTRFVRHIDPRHYAAATVWPAYVFNVYADRKNLWQVRTTEEVLRSSKTPLTLGVAEEHVKSLFYARNLPVTETGRKRPILHWVKAHARRMAEGTDVDVRKHLRGITEFEMDGMRFEIISPDKDAVRAGTA